MIKSQIHVLIVEDDFTQGNALREAFTRSGYAAILCTSSVQALTSAQRNEYHCLIVDCLLPKMNGVDLVEEILQFVPNKPKIFMMTGIFKDRAFIKDAMERTHATSFFVKPLILGDIVGAIDELFETRLGPETPPVLSLYSDHNLGDIQIVALIERESIIHSFHLPKLYQRMQESSLTGELTLISAVGDISTACFYKGQVFSVKTGDRDSYFGSLAVSYGFVLPEDVMAALKDKSQKVLGQKLVDSMSLSPHAVQVILEEQLALRLSQTIQNDVVSLQWITRKFTAPTYALAATRFELLLDDWMDSKITPEWIKSLLLIWGQYLLEGEYHAVMRGSQTVAQVFSNPQFDENSDLQALFKAFITSRAFIGARAEGETDFSFLASRLDKMADDFKTQNYFQFIGVGEKAHPREINRSFQGLKESFEPEGLPKDCPPEIVAKCQSVYQLILRAFDTISDDVQRLHYLQTLQNKRAQEVLEAEPIFRAAILELYTRRYQLAALKFQSLIDRKLEFKDLRAYRIWAGLKLDRNFVKFRIDQVPPEERHSAVFMMARGVYYRAMGQHQKALNAFRTAHVLDSRLRVASDEITAVAEELDRSGTNNRNMFDEVTSIAKNMFGKKPRRGA